MAGVSKRIGADDVLRGVDLTIGTGQVHALVGMNGAGKTTVMRIALGMLQPDAGTVAILGTPVADAGADVWRRVGHLIETPFAYPELTVRENIAAAARLRGIDAETLKPSLNRIVEHLGMGRWLDARVRTLSLGTRQKVGLAAALVHDPDLLILDEPANSLDPLAVVGLRELIGSATGRGVGVLLSSHHLDELARMADAISILHRGAIIGTIDPHAQDLERSFFTQVLSADSRIRASA